MATSMLGRIWVSQSHPKLRAHPSVPIGNVGCPNKTSDPVREVWDIKSRQSHLPSMVEESIRLDGHGLPTVCGCSSCRLDVDVIGHDLCKRLQASLSPIWAMPMSRPAAGAHHLAGTNILDSLQCAGNVPDQSAQSPNNQRLKTNADAIQEYHSK